jgi:PAS domain S-box-containing protein
MTKETKSDKRFSCEEILEASPDAIITMSQEGEILSWNRGAETTFGFVREEVLGRSVYDLIVPKDRKEETLLAIRNTLEGRQVVYESVRCRKDGSLVTVDISKGVIGMGAGPGPRAKSTSGPPFTSRCQTERKNPDESL